MASALANATLMAVAAVPTDARRVLAAVLVVAALVAAAAARWKWVVRPRLTTGQRRAHHTALRVRKGAVPAAYLLTLPSYCISRVPADRGRRQGAAAQLVPAVRRS